MDLIGISSPRHCPVSWLLVLLYPGLTKELTDADGFSCGPCGCLECGSLLPSLLLLSIYSRLASGPGLLLPRDFLAALFGFSVMLGLDLPCFLSLPPDMFLFSFLLSLFPSGSANVSKPWLHGMQLDYVVSSLIPGASSLK